MRGRYGGDWSSWMKIISQNTEGKVGIGVENLTKKLQVEGSIVPGTDDQSDLGKSDLRWEDIYAKNVVETTSDERQKDNIKDVPLGLDFISELRPIEYKWKDYHVPEIRENRTIKQQKPGASQKRSTKKTLN